MSRGFVQLRRADVYDNATAESVIGLYTLGCVRRDGPFRTADGLELATLNWVHWFNEHRLRSSSDHVPPVAFETQHYPQISTRQTAPRAHRPSTRRATTTKI